MEERVKFPEAFERIMLEKLGDDFGNFAAAHQQSTPVSVRINPKKQPSHITGNPVPWSSSGLYLKERPSFTLDPLFHAGTYYVQEPSSMFLEQAVREACDVSVPLRVLDLAAAPGGKSTHLLSLLHPESLLVSNEVIRSRASILAENIQKWGCANCLVTNNDPADFSSLHGFFDLMVVDAPCSGEGLFRKDPDAAASWSAANVELCAARQQRILHDAWPALKPGGVLIYCTCTFNEHENEINLERFAESYNISFLPVPTRSEWGVSEVKHKNVIGYRFYPHRSKGEGFFLAVLKKMDVTETVRRKDKGEKLAPAPQKFQARLRSWVQCPFDSAIFQHQDLLFLLPKSTVSDVDMLLRHLRLVYLGTNLATAKHEKLVPDHALALSGYLNHGAFPNAQLSLAEALIYLRKEALNAPWPPGFTLMTFEQFALGWANVLPNRVNNLYPNEWRIRISG